jgi:hypothetical protein
MPWGFRPLQVLDQFTRRLAPPGSASEPAVANH